MPNPRYLTKEGEPTVEMLQKLSLAKKVYFENLPSFCQKHYLDEISLGDIKQIFLIGSHATENEWDDNSSDLDLKLVNPSAIPENLWRYKKEILNPALCIGEKKRWIDLFFAREEYQVLDPKWDLTPYWNKDI
jgi:hypothetical protein